MKCQPANRRRSAVRPPAAGRQRRGSAILELALLLPILLSLALLCIDFGRVAFYYIVVTNAARAGAAYASANPSTASNWQSKTVSAVTDEFATNPWYNASASPNPLTIATPVVTQDANGDGYWYATVTVNYQFQTLINWPWLPGYYTPVTLTRTVVMRVTI